MAKLSFDIDAVIEGRARLTDEQAMELYGAASLHDLGQWAHARAQVMHPELRITGPEHSGQTLTL